MTSSRSIAAVRWRVLRRHALPVCCPAALCAVAPFGNTGTAARVGAAPPAAVGSPLALRNRPGAAFDVVRQELVVSDFAWIETADTGALEQPVKAAVSGTVQVVVVARQGLETLAFERNAMTVRRAADQRGQALSFTHDDESINLRLAKPAAAGDTVRVTLDYSGEVEGDGNTIFPLGQSGSEWRRSHWMMLGSGWSLGPSVRAESDEGEPLLIPGSVTITMPAEYQLVTDRELAWDSTRADGRHTLRWGDDRSKPNRFGAIIGRWSYVSDTWTRPDGRHVPIIVYFPPEKREGGRAALQVLVRAMDVFERTGNIYPHNSFKQLVAGRTEYVRNPHGTAPGGLGIVTDLPHPSRYPSEVPDVHVFVHELAHNLIFGPQEPEADFMWTQYEAAVGGPRAEQQAVGLMSDEAPDPNDSYAVGRHFYYMLKRHLGDDQFRTMLRTYVTKYSTGFPEYSPGLTEGFLKAIQETTGEDLRWFVDRWYFIGRSWDWPEFVVTAQYDAAAQRVTLQVEQTQEEDVSRMPVTVRVATPKGDVLATARLTGRSQTIVVERVPAAPTMVIFDDKDAMGKRLTFEQPTAWLLAQLEREPPAWQTWWAIKQLASRVAGDTAIKAALVRAVDSAQYPSTRAQALRALGSARVQVPLPVLRRATRDTAAQVRDPALSMLMSKSAAEALPILMEAFETDSVPFLRSAGLYWALQLPDWDDQPAKLALLRRALATPSGDDEVMVRTLDLIVEKEMCDDALVSAVEPLLGQHIVAVETAYKLSDECPGFAALLKRHRNDARPQVRRWIAQVYAGTTKTAD